MLHKRQRNVPCRCQKMMLIAKYLSSGVQCVACVLVVVALVADPWVQCAATSTAAPAISKAIGSLSSSTHAPTSVAPQQVSQGKLDAKVGEGPTVLPVATSGHPTIAAGIHATTNATNTTDAKAAIAPAAGAAAPVNASALAPVAAAAAAAAAASTPSQRLVGYFSPICEQLDKLQPKQMFKIQAQMKQFIEKTSGKMSLCFMQHYTIDPNLTPVNKAQLGTICTSRTLATSAKGSFKSFQACAEQNWDKNLDNELDLISKQTKSEPIDKETEKEAAVISDVVGTVLNDNKSAVSKSDIKVVDVGTKPAGNSSSSGSLQVLDKKILNDPNTVVVFVDETQTTKAPAVAATPKVPAAAVSPTSAAPVPAASASVAPATVLLSTLAPALPKAIASVAPAVPTTLKPAVEIKQADAGKVVVVSAGTTLPPAKTTAAPVASGPASLGEKILQAVSTMESSTVDPKAIMDKAMTGTTAKPVAGAAATAAAAKGAPTTKAASTTTSAPSAKPTTTTKPTSAAPKSASSSSKPASSTSAPPAASKPKASASTSKPAPAGGNDKETKLKAENAIKGLQMQRAQTHNSPSDARMHQLEHQRQMTIDPIGHTMKHQQYEAIKQSRAALGAL